MIQVDRLSMSYQGVTLFQEASFTLQEGERVGLVGRNGSGKTTLFRLILNQETPDSGQVILKKNKTLGHLSQHIHFTKKTLLDEACTALHEEDFAFKAEKILFGLGFKKEDMEKSPNDFSGGYQLRLHLAKTLIQEPDCLLLDEPTNYLDIVSIRWLEKFLQKWRGLFVLISHDREFMDSVTTHTLGIHREKIKKMKGGTEELFTQLLAEEQVHIKTFENLKATKEKQEQWIERFGAKATKAKQAKSKQKALDKLPSLEELVQLSHLNFEFNTAPFNAKKLLEARNLTFSWNAQPLIEKCSLSIEKGEKIAIIGKNGRGKSTLLQLLAQEVTPASGVLKQSEHLKIGYFGQTHIDKLHPDRTVEEEIALANPDLKRSFVKGICGVMLFSGLQQEKKISLLSGGERARVLLGKIIASPCNLLLLDEPTHHLDMESIEALIEAIQAFNGGLVLVTHSELLLRRIPLDKLIICKESNQELFLGNYEEFLDLKGWDDESQEREKSKKTDNKQSRRERAENVQERARLLKPINAAIKKIEASITKKEQELESLNQEMILSSQQGNSEKIQTLSIAINEIQNALDPLWSDLERLMLRRDEYL